MSDQCFPPIQLYWELTNECLWNIDNKHLNDVIFLDLDKPLTPWTMLFGYKSLNSMGSIVFLLNGFKWLVLLIWQKAANLHWWSSIWFLWMWYVVFHSVSILRPLLFNGLPSCNLFSKPRMYADDTILTSSAEDPYMSLNTKWFVTWT